MEGVEGRDAARRQGADAGAHCAFDQRRGASRARGRAAAALCRYRWPRQHHGWHRLWILAKPARRPRTPFDHVGEAEMPRRGRRHRLEAALALTSASPEWQLSAHLARCRTTWRRAHRRHSASAAGTALYAPEQPLAVLSWAPRRGTFQTNFRFYCSCTFTSRGAERIWEL